MDNSYKVIFVIIVIICIALFKDNIESLFENGTWKKRDAMLYKVLDSNDFNINEYDDYYTFLNSISVKNYVEWIPLSNGAKFYVGLDGYLYFKSKSVSGSTVIDGLSFKAHKTALRDVYQLFYCETDSEFVYVLTGAGDLYFVGSNKSENLGDIEPLKLNYRYIVDVYSKDGAVNAMDIKGNVYIFNN